MLLSIYLEICKCYLNVYDVEEKFKNESCNKRCN